MKWFHLAFIFFLFTVSVSDLCLASIDLILRLQETRPRDQDPHHLSITFIMLTNGEMSEIRTFWSEMHGQDVTRTSLLLELLRNPSPSPFQVLNNCGLSISPLCLCLSLSHTLLFLSLVSLTMSIATCNQEKQPGKHRSPRRGQIKARIFYTMFKFVTRGASRATGCMKSKEKFELGSSKFYPTISKQVHPVCVYR